MRVVACKSECCTKDNKIVMMPQWIFLSSKHHPCSSSLEGRKNMINIEGVNYSKTENGSLWQQVYVAKHPEVYPDHEFEKYKVPEMQCMICLEPGNCFDTWKCDLCSLTLHSSCVNGDTEIITTKRYTLSLKIPPYDDFL